MATQRSGRSKVCSRFESEASCKVARPRRTLHNLWNLFIILIEFAKCVRNRGGGNTDVGFRVKGSSALHVPSSYRCINLIFQRFLLYSPINKSLTYPRLRYILGQEANKIKFRIPLSNLAYDIDNIRGLSPPRHESRTQSGGGGRGRGLRLNVVAIFVLASRHPFGYE